MIFYRNLRHFLRIFLCHNKSLLSLKVITVPDQNNGYLMKVVGSLAAVRDFHQLIFE